MCLDFQKILLLILPMCQYIKNFNKIDIHFAFNLQVNSFVKAHKVTLQNTSNFRFDTFLLPRVKKNFFFKS